MSEEASNGGLNPVHQTYHRQKCFLGYSEQAEWTPDLLGACEEVLRRPEFDLEPDCAVWNFDAEVPLRQKVLELIANARYGIYDVSCWRDAAGVWHLPRNVLIELGMAIALNRPALLLRHLSSPEERLPACLAGLAGHIVCFAGETTLKRELEKRLPQWVQQPPEQSWWNRNCVVGGRRCEYRETHPRKEGWGRQSLLCLVADGPDVDREDFRAGLAEVLDRYRGVETSYQNALQPARGYDFLLCGLCQGVRSAPFGIFRITPQTPAEAYLALGMSLALETQFKYPIPKIVMVGDERDLPSLLRGYEVLEARNGADRKGQLRRAVPVVLMKVQQTAWKPVPLPFTEAVLPPLVLIATDQSAEQSEKAGNASSSSMSALKDTAPPLTEARPENAYLVVRRDDGYGDVFPLDPGNSYTLGRAATNNIVLKDDLCSRDHAEVVFTGGRWRVRDLGSLNGTRVNSIRVEGERELVHSDDLHMGRTHLLFVTDPSQLPDLPPTSEPAHDTPPPSGAGKGEGGVYGLVLERDGLNRDLSLLYRLGLDMGMAGTTDELCQMVLGTLLEATPANVGAILSIPDRAGPGQDVVGARSLRGVELEMTAYRHRDPSVHSYIRVSEYVSNEVLGSREAILAEDVARDRYLRNRESLSDLGATSLICAPILFGDKVLGLIHLYCTDPLKALDGEDLEFTIAVAKQLGGVIHNLQKR
jgi:hypothetical protein